MSVLRARSVQNGKAMLLSTKLAASHIPKDVAKAKNHLFWARWGLRRYASNPAISTEAENSAITMLKKISITTFYAYLGDIASPSTKRGRDFCQNLLDKTDPGFFQHLPNTYS